MKIFIITCHNVYNYGASLQSYGLLHYLHSRGHDVRIIDYRPDLFGYSLIGEILNVNNPEWNTNFIRRSIYRMTHAPQRAWEALRNRLFNHTKRNRFDRFTDKYLRLTTKRYLCFEELLSSDEFSDVDIFIAGSDQIWNTFDKKGRDPSFYLQFVPGSARRISYAASIASASLNPLYQDKVIKMISELDLVSVREHESIFMLKEMGVSEVFPVCDPVFLLDREDWQRLSSGIYFTSPFILVYDSDQSEEIRQIACSLSEQTGLPIVSVGPHRYSYVQENYLDWGPSEFIDGMMNAEYVVTNSFHALAFSLIFNKKFWIVPRTEDRNVRLTSILNFLNLENRIPKYSSMTPEILMEDIDFVVLGNKISEWRSTSMKFLERVEQ